jgi:hypothetical protein
VEYLNSKRNKKNIKHALSSSIQVSQTIDNSSNITNSLSEAQKFVLDSFTTEQKMEFVMTGKVCLSASNSNVKNDNIMLDKTIYDSGCNATIVHKLCNLDTNSFVPLPSNNIVKAATGADAIIGGKGEWNKRKALLCTKFDNTLVALSEMSINHPQHVSIFTDNHAYAILNDDNVKSKINDIINYAEKSGGISITANQVNGLYLIDDTLKTNKCEID